VTPAAVGGQLFGPCTMVVLSVTQAAPGTVGGQEFGPVTTVVLEHVEVVCTMCVTPAVSVVVVIVVRVWP
jgi:hypothetical protein